MNGILERANTPKVLSSVESLVLARKRSDARKAQIVLLEGEIEARRQQLAALNSKETKLREKERQAVLNKATNLAVPDELAAIREELQQTQTMRRDLESEIGILEDARKEAVESRLYAFDEHGLLKAVFRNLYEAMRDEILSSPMAELVMYTLAARFQAGIPGDYEAAMEEFFSKKKMYFDKTLVQDMREFISRLEVEVSASSGADLPEISNDKEAHHAA